LAAHYKLLSQIDFPNFGSDQIYTMVFDNGMNSEVSEIKFPIPGMSLDMPYLHRPFHSLSEEHLEHYSKVWANKLRSIVDAISPHVIHVNHLWLMPGIANVAVPWLPIVGTYHGSEFNLIKKSPGFAALALPGIRRLYTIMAGSNDSAQEAQQTFEIPPQQMRLVGNGYNPSLFRVLPRHDTKPVLMDLLKQSPPRFQWNKLVLYVGKMASYKGLPYLLRAAKLYNSGRDDVLTLIVGGGSKQVRKELNHQIDDLELTGKVIMLEKVAYHKVGLIMNNADVFVLPSIKEAFGLVLLEALACGVRGVAAAKGGAPFFIPEDLLERKFVSLIKPLRLDDEYYPDISDEDRYVNDLAIAIHSQLDSTTGERERQFIAEAVKDQTWSSRAKLISHTYFDAIQRHRAVLTS
jgi:glycosyltransferase involved in cell wall biosynthesis